MQSQGLNSNYLYQLMHINNGAEIPSEGNSRTEPNSSRETAPVRYQLLVQGCPARSDTGKGTAASGGRRASAPSSGLPRTSSPAAGGTPCYNQHPTSCSALGRKHLCAFAPITFSLGKTHTCWHPVLQCPSTPRIAMEWQWDNESSTIRMMNRKSLSTCLTLSIHSH